MNIKQKIIFYFSVVSIPLIGLAFFFVYTFFNEYRQEEFRQEQKGRITTTLQLLSEVKQEDEKIQEALDRFTIYDYYDEKLLIYNHNQVLLYSSTENISSPDASGILAQLSSENQWVKTREGRFDVIGVYWQNNGNVFYGVSKAFDTFGYSKLRYLSYVLLLTFLIISGCIMLIAYYLSRTISLPITQITRQINSYDFGASFKPIELEEKNGEIAQLAKQFNLLLKQMYDAFAFQKHAIHHISHELKTPIAILVSNFERIEKMTEEPLVLQFIKDQKEDTKNLADIVNALLEISKAEQHEKNILIRIDELLYDTIANIQLLNEDFLFDTQISGKIEDENCLTVRANFRLLTLAVMNLLVNCVQYSSERSAKIVINSKDKMLNLHFINKGPIIPQEEQKFLFRHFFRGKNSTGKRGFGLGLVLVDKIMQLNEGSIRYETPNQHTNVFILSLPLS